VAQAPSVASSRAGKKDVFLMGITSLAGEVSKPRTAR